MASATPIRQKKTVAAGTALALKARAAKAVKQPAKAPAKPTTRTKGKKSTHTAAKLAQTSEDDAEEIVKQLNNKVEALEDSRTRLDFMLMQQNETIEQLEQCDEEIETSRWRFLTALSF